MGFHIRVDGRELVVNGPVPVLPLRDVVVFPHLTLPLFVGRPGSVAAIERARQKKLLLATAQRRPEVSEPGASDLFVTGTLVRVLQIYRMPDGTMRVLVEGLCRAQIDAFHPADAGADVEIRPLPEANPPGRAVSLLLREVQTAFAEYAGRTRRVSEDARHAALEATDPVEVGYLVAAQVMLKVTSRQEVLESADAASRLRLVRTHLERELDALRAESRAAARASSPADRKRVVPEPPENPEPAAEVEEVEAAIRAARMPAPVRTRAMQELDRLTRMPLFSPEATVTRSYLLWLTSVPWFKKTRDRRDLAEAERILEMDHHGLKRVKERILEHLAVVQLTRRPRGPVLCLVGPPGVGKTSLGRSVAHALGRRFARISLGGVRDEAEIRGHRRTYIGSMPGRIVQSMRRAGTVNPVLLLDEVDKLGTDYRGDPASALLEVLDPEQNWTFSDHYLEIDYDLSRVLFLTTANRTEDIPAPLLDRMELIRLPGYLETEKLEIARHHLFPRQRQAAGLTEQELAITPEAMQLMIRSYTREAGVRSLDRELASVARKIARKKASGKLTELCQVGPAEVEQLLGPATFLEPVVMQEGRVGVATGLAWTETGGEVLVIEVTTLPGTGQLVLTGRLGETMRESAQAAASFIRSRAAQLGLEADFHRNLDLHIHVPEGAVPKNGPSAGTTIALALASALTGRPTRETVAVSGEITLRGQVLAVGGLPEKAVAAHRAGVRTLLLPESNRRHLGDIPEEVRRDLEIVLVSTMDEVLEAGLAPRKGASRGRKSSSRLYAA